MRVPIDEVSAWDVTTDSNEEGKGLPTQLGVWTGPIDRIALVLGHKAYRGLLRFEPSDARDATREAITRREVHFSVAGYDSSELLHELNRVGIEASTGHYYQSVKVRASEAEYRQSLATAARAKLTDDEFNSLMAMTLADEGFHAFASALKKEVETK